jgi:hypothetical protein
MMHCVGLVKRSTVGAFLILLIFAAYGQQRLQAGADCGREFDACFRACPNTLSNTCLFNCSKRNDACRRDAEQERKSERALQQCSSLPSDKKRLAAPIDSAWLRKKIALNDGIVTLRKLRSSLENDFMWTVGDPGSVRELTTYLALVTKTTAKLVEDLGGFSHEKSARAAKDIYEAIKQGRTAYEVITEDARRVVVNVLLDAAADVNVAARTAKAIKDFAENIAEMSKAAEELKAAREEVGRQLENIDKQIVALQGKIDLMRREHEPDEIESLFQTYASVRELCTAAPVNVSRP